MKQIIEWIDFKTDDRSTWPGVDEYVLLETEWTKHYCILFDYGAENCRFEFQDSETKFIQTTDVKRWCRI